MGTPAERIIGRPSEQAISLSEQVIDRVWRAAGQVEIQRELLSSFADRITVPNFAIGAAKARYVSTLHHTMVVPAIVVLDTTQAYQDREMEVVKTGLVEDRAAKESAVKLAIQINTNGEKRQISLPLLDVTYEDDLFFDFQKKNRRGNDKQFDVGTDVDEVIRNRGENGLLVIIQEDGWHFVSLKLPLTWRDAIGEGGKLVLADDQPSENPSIQVVAHTVVTGAELEQVVILNGANGHTPAAPEPSQPREPKKDRRRLARKRGYAFDPIIALQALPTVVPTSTDIRLRQRNKNRRKR